MKAVEFEECNVEIAKNQKEYKTLPAYVDKELGTVTVCFELDNEELKQIRQTNKFWLTLLTFNKPLQPIKQSCINPFQSQCELKPFKIYHNSTTKFSFFDRFKILFGFKVRIETEINVDGEVVILDTKSNTRLIKNKYIKRNKGLTHV